MTFIPPKDRVLEHSSSNSQTIFTVTGAIDTSFNAFSASMSIGDTTIGYVVEPGVAFKSGLLTYSASSEVTVTTAFESKGTFSSSGTKEVAMGMPASRLVSLDGAQSLTQPQQATILKNIGAAQFNLKNGKIVESHAASAATFAIKGLDGNDPSASNPVTAIMPDGTIVALTAALSLTIPSTATMGATNGNHPFRLWFILINDSGTLRLGVRNCSDASGIYGFPGHGVITTSGAPGSSVGVTYSGTAVTNGTFIIIGSADYTAGLATAGTWNTSPSSPNLLGVGLAKPGDMVQKKVGSSTAADGPTAGTTPAQSSLNVAIIPTSSINKIEVKAQSNLVNATNSQTALAQIFRGIGGTAIGNKAPLSNNTGTYINASADLYAFDVPETFSSVTYVVYFNGDGVGSFSFGTGLPQRIEAVEWMS